MHQAWDSDGHVEEWEETFSDAYLEPAFRDRRPVVVDPGGDRKYHWHVPGLGLIPKIGGSPVSKDGVASRDQAGSARWRGTLESAEFRSAETRLALLDAESTSVQVNYPTMLLGWPLVHDPALNAALARAYNNWVADVSDQAPDRLKWVSIIDPGDPRDAVKEIQRTRDMGSVGVMVFGVYGARSIDEPHFEPIWAAAAEAGMPIAVHPGHGALDLTGPYPNFSEHQFKFSILMGFKRIILSGLLDRYPDLKVGFLETGCSWVDFMVDSIKESIESALRHAATGTLRNVPEGGEPTLPRLDVEDYLRRGQVCVGFEVDEDLLPYMVEKYGDDCWLYASDIPHAHRVVNAPRALQARTDLSDGAKRKLLTENTGRFYGLPVSSPAA